MFQMKKDCPTTDMIVRALQPDTLTNKVMADKFNAAPDKQRKDVLNAAFGMAMEKANGNVIDTNLTCFNTDHEDKHPSMRFDKEKGRFHCYGCMDDGENCDVFDAIKAVYGYVGFKDCYNKAVELFVDRPEDIVSDWKPLDLFPKAMYKTLKNPHYTPIHKDADGLEYVLSRGISRETAVRHGLMTWEYQGWLFIVFVNDNGSVVRRRFAKTADANGYSDIPEKWWNSSGQGGFFNLRVIEKARAKQEVVFLTESAFDALTLAELGFHAVGLNSVNRFRGLLQETDYPYLVGLFDNDDTGRNKTAIVRNNGFFVTDYDPDTLPFLSQHKDVNQALIANRGATQADLLMLECLATQHYGLQ